MTTPTADKGELLPRSDSQEAKDRIQELFSERDWPCNPNAAARCGWEAARRYLYNRRPTSEQKRTTNEGQDGLTDVILEVLRDYKMQFCEEPDNGAPVHLVDVLTPAGDSDITRGDQELEIIADDVADAIARHLSSKQADHIGEANKMVKADTVKMPEPDGYLWRGIILKEDWKYAPPSDKEQIDYMLDYRYKGEVCYEIKPIYFNATAHTAEAIRELVEGLRDVSDSLAYLRNHLDAQAQHGPLDNARALLAKYAPSQEVK